MARARPWVGRLGLAVALAAALAAALFLGLGRGGREGSAQAPAGAARLPASPAPAADLDAGGANARRPEGPGASPSASPDAAGSGAPAPDPATPSAPRREHLSGRVTDELGQPLAARVSLQLRRTETDPSTGAFDLDLAGFAPLGDPLIATARGFAPAVLDGVGRSFVDAGRTHPPLALVLHPAGLLAGRVLRPGGEPAGGVLVGVREAVPDGEGLAERSASTSGSLPVETDPDGTFVLDGLLRAPYTLIAVDPATLDRVERAATPDAEGVELRLPSGARRDVAGVARFADGAPLEGRTISACVSLPGGAFQPYRIRRSAVADARGAFLLEDLPSQDLELFAGPEAHPWSFPLPADATRVELVLHRLCPLVLRWPAGSPPPDAARCLSAAGEELALYQSQWGAIRPDRRLRFAELRGGEGELTASLLAPESASVLLLERDGRTLCSAPVVPRAEVETVVHP